MKKSTTLTLLVSAVFMTLPLHAEGTRVVIRSLYDIENAFCAVKTNDFPEMDNRYSAQAGVGFGTESFSAMMVMENGENEISLEIGSLGWFDTKKLSNAERAKFNPQAMCKLALNATVGDYLEGLSAIEVTIGKDGLPEASGFANTHQYDVVNTPVIRQKVRAPTVVAGHVDRNYFTPQAYPAGMELYRFSRKVVVQGLPEWPWVNATPYTNTPAQRQELEQAYLKVWQALNNKDMDTYRQQLKMSLSAWAWSVGTTEDMIFARRRMDIQINNPTCKMIPINWRDYDVQIMNNGRMVRLINKSDPSVSPLSYHYEILDGKKQITRTSLSAVFALIDGEFKLVI